MSQFDSLISQAPLLAPTVPSISRGVQQITAPEEQEFDPAPIIRRQQQAEMNRTMLDFSVELNRKATPQAAIEKRASPRYSLAEINEMDMETLRQRFEKLPPLDDRPGIMRVLDVIDLPRNLVGNAISGIFAPQLRQQAIERGEFGAFGLPRVMGSDMLRAMGVENRVINAIGGFGIDILTDPLSFIGAPLGGLAVRAGKAGSVQLGRTGQKTLMGSFKDVQKGGLDAVKDQTVRRMFEATAARHGISTVDNPELASQLSARLLGDRSGRVRSAADLVLGTSGRDGELATLLNSVTTGKATAEAEQIAAVKDFVREFTLNRGLKIGGDRAAVALAHIPMRDVTVYVPAFGKFGKQATLQRAIALAKEGRFVPAEAFNDLQSATDLAGDEFRKMVDLLEEREMIRKAEETGSPLEVQQRHVVSTQLKQETIDKDLRRDARSATPAGRAQIEAEREAGQRAIREESAARRTGETLTEGATPDPEIPVRQDVDYRRTNKAEDLQGFAITDMGQPGLAAVAMLAKNDGALVGKKVEAVDPRTVRVGDEFQIGEADVRVIDDLGDSVEVQVTYPTQTVQREALPGADDQAGFVETTREGFTTNFTVSKADGAYIPVNKDSVQRGIIRTPQDAWEINSANIAAQRTAIAASRDQVAGALQKLAQDGGAFEQVDAIGDLLAMVEMANGLQRQVQYLESLDRWSDASINWTRAGEEIGQAKRVREVGQDAAAREAFRQADGTLPPEVANASTEDLLSMVDEMAPDDARLDAFLRLRREHEANTQDTIRKWLDLADDDLELASEVADAYGDLIKNARELADAGMGSVRQHLSSDAMQLRRVAERLLGMDGETAGKSMTDMLTAPAGATIAKMHPFNGDLSGKVAALASWTTENFGVGVFGLENGMVNSHRARAQQQVRVASRGEAMSMKRQVYEGGPAISKGLRQIAKDHGLDQDNLDDMDTLVTAILASRGGEQGVFFTHHPDGRLKESVRLLQESASSGILKGREGLVRDLTTLADEIDGELMRLGDGSVELGLLKTMHRNYIPTQMTPEAAERARTMRRFGGSSGGRGATAELLEQFQQTKGTWEIRYTNADGEVKSFTLHEAKMFRNVDEQVWKDRGLVPEQIQIMQTIRDNVREFEAMYGSLEGPNGGAIANAHGRALDPFELNRMAEDGLFVDMTGELTDNLWQTRASDLLASSVQQHSVAHAKQSFRDYVSQFGIPINKLQPAYREGGMGKLEVGANGHFLNATTGVPITTADGTRITIISTNRVKVGDRTYRFVDTTKLQNLAIDPTEGMFKDGSMRYLYPEAVADTIERFATQLQPESLKGVLKVADDFTRVWRGSTLAHASWTVSTILGTAFQAAMDVGANMPEYGRILAGDAVKVLLGRNGDPNQLASKMVDIGAGQQIPADELVRLADSYGITQGGLAADAMEHVLRNGFDPQRVREPIQGGPVMGRARREGRRFSEKYVQTVREMLYAREAGNLGDNPISKGYRHMKATREAMRDSPFSGMMRAWFRVNGMVDDSFRLAGFIYYLRQGNDIPSAAAATKRTFFSFSDMTRNESQNLRALMPFYAWLRASGPSLVGRLATDPRYSAVIPKLTEAIEELTAGEEQVPRHRRPRWVNEQLGVQLGSNEETRQVLLAGTLWPQEQALRIASGLGGLAGAVLPGDQGFGGREVMDLLDFFIAQTGPAVKIPVELGLGRETFSGRTIGPSSYEGDLSMSEYLLGQVRWAREMGVGSVREGALQRSFEQGIGSGVGRLLIGGRLQPALQEDRRQFGVRRDMATREEQIRRAFNLAQREGDERAMLDARDALMSLYRDFLQSGGNPGDIPKWAREDLAEIGASVPDPVDPAP